MYERTFTPEWITELKPNEIFVFGSNLAGMHGGGAARVAMERFGAIWGQCVGLQGLSYGIPTMQGGGETRQKLDGTTIADYEPFLGIWHEMDNHGYRDSVPIERRGDRLKLKFDVLLHGEFEYEITTFNGPRSYRVRPGDRLDLRIRFAAFADFGLLNINPKTDNVLYNIPKETIYDFPTYRVNHVFSTTDAHNYWLRNLYVGARITILLGIPGNEKCILCNPGRH